MEKRKQLPFHRPFRRITSAAVLGGFFACAGIQGQTPQAQSPPALTLPTLSLKDAEAMALQNHPQIQAAQHEAAYAGQQITITRSALYPTVTGDLTGSQANNLARIGAGD